jgi:transcriptional regulator with GAF, ATPase, and Fis domain
MAKLIVIQKSDGGEIERTYPLRKAMTTVGTDPGHDILIDAEDGGVLFNVTRAGEKFEVLPGRQKLRLNGSAIRRATRLGPGDRLEWDGGAAVYLYSDSGDVPASSNANRTNYLEILQNLANTLQSPGAFQAALYQVLDGLVEMSGAEVGHLLTEMREDSGWELLASREADPESAQGARKASRKTLFSNTILRQAITTREPVYVENIIGHPWADAASVVEARIFSAACLPLTVADRVFGAVFLFTRTPGRTIKREYLPELRLLATQSALMLASQANLRDTKRENSRLRRMVERSKESGMIFAPGSPVEKVLRKVEKLAPTPLSVLIQGETGTGKELVARAIHDQSDRAKRPFVAVNCAAIPETLLESTLFGHEKGAFTGAVQSRAGKFQEANGGTLFLDEIGDLPLELQAKILRALQEQVVEPLGSNKPVKVNVRIVSATHQNLPEMAKMKAFRQDLFFRLSGATVALPALRERKADISFLAGHFIEKAGAAGVKLSKAAIEKLEGHSWPGNVRELEQVVFRASLLSDGLELSSEDIEIDDLGRNEKHDYFAESFDSVGNLREAQLAFTRQFAQRALEEAKGNRLEAALRLGVSERTLYRIMSDSPAHN